jgi:hypothetical protein
VIPRAHRLGVLAPEYSAAGDNARQTVAHLGLNRGDGCGTDAAGFVKVRTACAIGVEKKVQWRLTRLPLFGVEFADFRALVDSKFLIG